jgi:hypothetical protein
LSNFLFSKRKFFKYAGKARFFPWPFVFSKWAKPASFPFVLSWGGRSLPLPPISFLSFSLAAQSSLPLSFLFFSSSSSLSHIPPLLSFFSPSFSLLFSFFVLQYKISTNHPQRLLSGVCGGGS